MFLIKIIDCLAILAILARHLEEIMPEIISLDQTGFIRQRQTQDNIRRTLHVMQHIIKQVEATVVGLDAEKAFNSVRWDFLYRVLKQFNFHETLIKTLRALYNKPTARIKINESLEPYHTRTQLSTGLLSESSSLRHLFGTSDPMDKTK